MNTYLYNQDDELVVRNILAIVTRIQTQKTSSCLVSGLIASTFKATSSQSGFRPVYSFCAASVLFYVGKVNQVKTGLTLQSGQKHLCQQAPALKHCPVPITSLLCVT